MHSGNNCFRLCATLLAIQIPFVREHDRFDANEASLRDTGQQLVDNPNRANPRHVVLVSFADDDVVLSSHVIAQRLHSPFYGAVLC